MRRVSQSRRALFTPRASGSVASPLARRRESVCGRWVRQRRSAALSPWRFDVIPGEILPGAGEILLNCDRATLVLTVANTGDRPIQVGSHFHFAETNAALAFDRDAARGYRLDIPAGTAVRFEPGQSREGRLAGDGGAPPSCGVDPAGVGAPPPP